MRTAKELSPLTSTVYVCELEYCPRCHCPLSRCDYRSGDKTVQKLNGVHRILYQPKCCVNPDCEEFRTSLRSAEWLQIAPLGGTYGYDVIAMIGWQRQEFCRTFEELYVDMRKRVAISESQVRYLYHHHYLPLLACHERQHVEQLKEVSRRTGLLVSLDGLAPEGGEAQLWVVRELRTGLTLRSGWMSLQDQTAFENFLFPIATSGFEVSVVLSDKQRGLVPAIATVFPEAKHALCQSHYLRNIAEPIATADENMKVTLRKKVRSSIGPTIRAEQVEHPGVLTVTGVLPSALEVSEAAPESTAVPPQRSRPSGEEEKKRKRTQRRGQEGKQRLTRLTSGMRL